MSNPYGKLLEDVNILKGRDRILDKITLHYTDGSTGTITEGVIINTNAPKILAEQEADALIEVRVIGREELRSEYLSIAHEVLEGIISIESGERDQRICDLCSVLAQMAEDGLL